MWDARDDDSGDDRFFILRHRSPKLYYSLVAMLFSQLRPMLSFHHVVRIQLAVGYVLALSTITSGCTHP